MSNNDEEDELDDQCPDQKHQEGHEEAKEPEHHDKKKLTLTLQFQKTSLQVAVSYTTAFSKVFGAAEKRLNKMPGSLRFIYDGERLQKEDTPKMHEMADQDVIDVELEQLGGSVV